MRLIVVVMAMFFWATPCFAWMEGGHHLIAVLAFHELTQEQQGALLDILKSHPRFEQDFKIPEKAGDAEHWLIGRAANWPDLVALTPFERPKWHYQRGASVILKNVASEAPPIPYPGPDATMETQDLYIGAALQLCRVVMKDKTRPKADRAVALCWIGHLLGDSHQPCHSGSLYCPEFPDGDRGANLIPTIQGRNLHAVWDGLLGTRFDAGDVKRRAIEIKQDTALWEAARNSTKDAARWDTVKIAAGRTEFDPMEVWLRESAQFAATHVYTSEILKPIEALKSPIRSTAIEIGKGANADSPLKPIQLSEEYLKAAGAVAQKRAAFAGARLAAIWRDALE